MKRFPAFNPASRVLPQARKAALWLCLVLAALTFSVNRANATHAAGADISYKWISGNTYEITVAFYRFCSGVPAPTSVSVNVRSASLGVNFPKVLPKIPGTGVEITYPCGGTTNCNGGSILGIQQYVYRSTVVLPNPAVDWTFSYQICCRNCEITTITHPTPCNTTNTEPQLYVEAKLNSVEAPTNSSPSFSLFPVGFICADQPFTFNQGAIDIDGDSLAYSLITPKTSATTNVTFVPPFTATAPISTTGGVALNGSNGQIEMTPNSVGQIGILAVLVREYRNGVLISSTIRDMQFSVINCVNSNPTATGVNGGTDYTFTVCPGETVNFNIFAGDDDSTQTLQLEWNGGILDPDATFTVAGQPPVGTFNWVTDSANAQTQPHTFVVTVRDNGCNYNQQQSYIFEIFVVNIQPNFTVVDPLCSGGASASIAANPTGGTAPYTYTWSNGGTDAAITNLTAGTYTVTVTDAGGCTGVGTAVISNPVPVSATAVVDSNVTCAGDFNGQATVTAIGGLPPYTYEWSIGSVGTTATGLNAGVHTVTVTDANGCTTVASVEIEQTTLLLVDISSLVPPGCAGESTGSIDITVSGGTAPYTYLWSPNGDTTEDLTGIPAGLYDLLVSDVNGCLAAATIAVNDPDTIVPLITAIDITPTNILCFGNATGAIDVQIVGGTAPFTFTWSNGATDEDLFGLSAGFLAVTVQDQNGCSNIDSVELTQPLVPFVATVDTFTNPSCSGVDDAFVTVSVSGGNGPLSFEWSNGALTQNLTGVGAGTYTLTVTDIDLCTATATVDIVSPALLSVVALPVDTVDFEVNCNGENSGAINAIVTGGTEPYTYLWSNGATASGIGALFAGEYGLTVIDANGCSGIDSVMLTQPDTIVPLIESATVTGGNNVLCFGDSTAFAIVAATGGTPPYNYSWSNGATTDTVLNIGAGQITVQVFDQNGCSATDTFNVSQPAEILATFDITPLVCTSTDDAAVDMTVSGGLGNYTFAWSNGATTEDLSGLTAGTYNVTITDENACTATFAATIEIPNVLVVTADITDAICEGSPTGAIDVMASAGAGTYTFAWSNGSTDEDIFEVVSGVYTVSVTDTTGCEVVANFTVSNTNVITLFFTGTDVSCFGLFDGTASVEALGGIPPYAYNWSNGDSLENITNIGSGIYDVTVTDSIGCTVSGNFIVSEPAAVEPGATVTDVSFCADSTGAITLAPSGGVAPYEFQWNYNEAISESLTGLAQGTYTVTITDANFCA
ncbi:MAG TPA: SprB repeat-containing protein, partial [Chitinophagales bacterium]|nr:SprB repeat-containing protein [Chitinophagales bacterium]